MHRGVMNRLEKLKENTKHEFLIYLDKTYNNIQQANMPTSIAIEAFDSGFDTSSAEYENIIAELEGALDNIANRGVGYNLSLSSLNFRLDSNCKDSLEALQKLRDFRE
jgi:hypothetical protein